MRNRMYGGERGRKRLRLYFDTASWSLLLLYLKNLLSVSFFINLTTAGNKSE